MRWVYASFHFQMQAACLVIEALHAYVGVMADMPVVKVTARVVQDDTGVAYEIPVLIGENGDVRLLTNYLVLNSGKSGMWKARVVRAVKIMIEYIEANPYRCEDPELVFAGFMSHLYSGTIGDDGLDPSGLGWVPASSDVCSRIVDALNDFFDYASEKLGKATPNPMVKASSHDEMLNYAAWFKKNNNNFLGHISKAFPSVMLQQARAIRPQGRLTMSSSTVPQFPRSLFMRMYLDGFGGDRDVRCIVRDRLILLLLDAGGCRESEPLHLWINDVSPDPRNTQSALVKIYHPVDGAAPSDIRKKNCKEKHAAFLKRKYGLVPRNLIHGSQRVGWKGRVVDDSDKYIQVFWFDPIAGEIFQKLWSIHIRYLAPIERHHPYAFVSYESNNFGEPYSLNAFNSNYEAALARIGQTPSKREGKSTHGHRHAYSLRLRDAGLSPEIRKKALHHGTLSAQDSYSKFTNDQVTDALNKARERLEGEAGLGHLAEQNNDWDEILRSGFEDIDPDGLLSGPNPKLRRR